MFEGVYSHVTDLLRKNDFGSQFFFEIYDHVFQSDFGPLFNSSNFRFWSRLLVLIEIAAFFIFDSDEVHAIYSHCITSLQSVYDILYVIRIIIPHFPDH